MLRAQTMVALKEYHSALFDVNRLMELNPSSEIYTNLQARLRIQLACHHLLHCNLIQNFYILHSPGHIKYGKPVRFSLSYLLLHFSSVAQGKSLAPIPESEVELDEEEEINDKGLRRNYASNLPNHDRRENEDANIPIL
ncbi:hypothetical protein SAY86_026831 [Trapa natans]|uniref:Uncharacterized protein n=1 Tax=Trapa natans TaxID=22666 RepID=A0AAN7KKF9_TRANT|nr:hypothetical protein SAY86_026831 [Trapa natans]